jgi:hypothetical protein
MVLAILEEVEPGAELAVLLETAEALCAVEVDATETESGKNVCKTRSTPIFR